MLQRFFVLYFPFCSHLWCHTQLKISPQHWLESSAPFHFQKLRFASSCILLSPHTESKNEIETWQQTWLFRNVYCTTCTWSIFNQRLTLSCQRIVVMRLVQIYVRWTCPSEVFFSLRRPKNNWKQILTLAREVVVGLEAVQSWPLDH